MAWMEAALNIDGVLNVTMQNGGQITPRVLWATARLAGTATTATTTNTAAARPMSQRRTERLFKRASGLIQRDEGHSPNSLGLYAIAEIASNCTNDGLRFPICLDGDRMPRNRSSAGAIRYEPSPRSACRPLGRGHPPA